MWQKSQRDSSSLLLRNDATFKLTNILCNISCVPSNVESKQTPPQKCRRFYTPSKSRGKRPSARLFLGELISRPQHNFGLRSLKKREEDAIKRQKEELPPILREPIVAHSRAECRQRKVLLQESEERLRGLYARMATEAEEPMVSPEEYFAMKKEGKQGGVSSTETLRRLARVKL